MRVLGVGEVEVYDFIFYRKIYMNLSNFHSVISTNMEKKYINPFRQYLLEKRNFALKKLICNNIDQTENEFANDR